MVTRRGGRVLTGVPAAASAVVFGTSTATGPDPHAGVSEPIVNQRTLDIDFTACDSVYG